MWSSAEPHSTGTISWCSVASRSTWRIRSAGTGAFCQHQFGQLVAELEQLGRASRRATARPRRCRSGGNRLAVDFGCPGCRPVNVRYSIVDQVDHAAERVAAGGAARRRPAAGSATGLRIQPLADFVERAVEIGPFAVHLVDERDPRHAVFVGLPPDGFALGLDPLAGAEHDHAAVQHAQAALDFGREIDVARRVDQVDRAVVPLETSRRPRGS